MKHMDKSKLFDQKLKEAVENFEVPFDTSAWDAIKDQVGTPEGNTAGSESNFVRSMGQSKWISLAITAAASIVIAYFALTPSNETVETQPLVEQEQVQPKQDESDPQENAEEAELIVEKSDASTTDDVVNNEDNVQAPMEDQKISDEKETIVQKDEGLKELKSEDNTLIEQPEENVVMNEERINPITKELSVDVSMNASSICQNQALMMEVEDSNSPVEIHWDLGDGTQADGPHLSHVYAEEGQYKVIMTARSVIDEELERQKEYTINVLPSPQSDFQVAMNDNMAAFPEVNFFTNTDNGYDYEWLVSNEKVSEKSSFSKMFRNKGSYAVGLIVENQFSCSDTLYKDIQINNDFNLLAPNAFSPNGDGINDVFMPQALSIMNQEFTLQIFEPKSGKMIFESSSVDFPWNGSFMNSGTDMKEGAYAWSVRMADGSIYKGTILITSK